MSPPSPLRVQALGFLLFLFIPLVLFLYLQHPEPVGLSLAAGVILMIGHRRLARPYMQRVLPWKCVWCNRILPAEGGETIDLQAGPETLTARCCSGHREPAARFFAVLQEWKWPLRLGIFVPLLVLLVALAATAFGLQVPLERIISLFKLVVGVSVNMAALGTLFMSPAPAAMVPFPAHNFFLLGVRILLWIFRLVGLWWIFQVLS